MFEELDEIRGLFADAVPEIVQGVVEIKAIARERGKRTKVVVLSHDSQVDPLAACVGVRGQRIRQIVEWIGGCELLDVVRWTESLEALIADSLQPAEILFVRPDHLLRHAKVFVGEDQASLALGYEGLNRRLASELTGVEIEIMPLKKETRSDDNR